MRIAVVGAGLSGSYLACQLASAGAEVRLFGDHLDWEKPCGGGVTSRALEGFPLLTQRPIPGNEVAFLELISSQGERAVVPLRKTLTIYSRRVLDGGVRQAALRAGAELVPEKVRRVQQHQGGWQILTGSGTWTAELLVGADGCKSLVRQATGQDLAAQDTSLTLGYFLPGKFHSDTSVCQFYERGFEGYLWSFPRPDHLSVGILNSLPLASSAELRRKVEAFIGDRYPGSDPSGANYFAALVPALRESAWKRHRAAGENWALVGDAAGCVDPVTGEGISHALRSSELLAQALAAGKLADYEDRFHEEFRREFQAAARWKERFYRGRVWKRSFVDQLIHLCNRSKRVRELLDRLITGDLCYRELARELCWNVPAVTHQYVRSLASV
ncbi:MAG: NAD(P)/FAD-dependent oxidoreductase [Acidobacteria bacterium]|nr:NAD(P)/FAD-dependent oxidoreductase [Acidobacteriota bacterium]